MKRIILYILVITIVSGCAGGSTLYYGSTILPSNDYYHKTLSQDQYQNTSVVNDVVSGYDPWTMGMYYDFVSREYVLPTTITVEPVSTSWDSSNRPSIKDKIKVDAIPRAPSNIPSYFNKYDNNQDDAVGTTRIDDDHQIIRRRAPSTMNKD